MEPLEIERKFLIRMPSLAMLDALCTRRIAITQTYLLPGPEGETRRLRRSREGDRETLYFTEKKHITDITRVEREREISPEEYAALLTDADGERRPIEKVRRCIPYEGHTLEIDVFPFWTDRAFCECELSREDEALSLPPWLEVVREVTGDRRYTNNALARCIPAEEPGGSPGGASFT